MKKRILPILLALVMMLSLMPTIALADDPVATVNGQDYYDLAEAINAANNGDTVVIAEGDYELSSARGPFSIWKAVSLEGAGAGKTTIKGRIEYAVTGTADEVNKISVEGITFEPLNGDNHQALCWSNDQSQGSTNELSGYELVVKDCEFIGWKYAVGVNSCANDCGLNVENTKFENVFCATSVQEGNGNKLNAFGATADSTFEYAAQVWGSNNGSDYNCYYDSFKSLREDVGRSNPDADNISAPGVWPAAAKIGNTYYATVGNAVNKANDGDTVVIAAGEYEIGAISTDKAVNLEGQGNVTLKGSIDYTSTANNETVSISNLAFENNTNHALNFSGLQNSEINVTGCTFTGSEFGIGVNSNAKNNVLTVSNSEFNNVGCAAGIKVGTANNNATFVNVDTNGGFAVQAFNGVYSGDGQINSYYTTYDNYVNDKGNDYKNPDFNAVNSDYTLVTPATFASKLASANDDDTLLLAPGTYTAPSSAITKRINLKGYGADQTVIVGKVQYQFSESQNDKSVTVSDLTIKAGDGVQGLQFRGDKPNDGYDLDIIVEDCAFEGWTYGITMNSHANGYDMTVRNCDFSKSLYAVSYNYDVTTAGQQAKNSLTFAEGNVIAENGFAVQKFSNNPATNYDDKTYDTIANFEDDQPTITGTVVYVAANANLATAVSNARDGATIIVAPGTYSGNIQFGGKSLTIKAQYPAYKDGDVTEDAKLSKFTGTFNTSEGTNDSDFVKDQVVTIDGFAFSGDGLKVGNTNYNTVGNLVVQNCTMECANDLSKQQNYNKYNHFVKISGNAGEPYAKVTVKNNKVTGTLVNKTYAITPIQLWDVKEATVTGNVIDVTGESHQAISISIMAEDAKIEVANNDIKGTGYGIFVTTWKLGGKTVNGEATFTGSVSIHDNDMYLVGNGTPIFIGYEEAAGSGNPYGKLSIDATFANYDNTNHGEIVLAEISQMPGAPALFYTVTYMDGKNEIGSDLVKADGTGTVKLFTPSKPGYIFMGWKCSDGDTHQAGEVIKVTKNMTFTAIWANMPDITPGTPGGDDEPVVPAFPFTDVREGQWFYEAVKYVYSEGIMNGMDRYTFAPNGSLTRAMVWTMLARLDGVDTEGGATWYSKAQEWAVEAGVSDGTDPMGNITREQLVTMLWRLNGSETTTGSLTGYTDYDKVSDWAGNAMLWATVNGIIEGDENSALNPTAGCTRAQAAAMLMRFCENVELSPTV